MRNLTRQEIKILIEKKIESLYKVSQRNGGFGVWEIEWRVEELLKYCEEFHSLSKESEQEQE